MSQVGEEEDGNVTSSLFSLLSVELLELVFSYLPLAERIRLGRVCKMFYGVSILVKELDGRHLGGIVAERFYMCLPEGVECLYNLILQKISNASKLVKITNLENILCKCAPHLCSLNLCRPPVSFFRQPSLEVYSSLGFPSLRKLDLACTILSSSSLLEFLKSCPHITHVAFQGELEGASLRVTDSSSLLPDSLELGLYLASPRHLRPHRHFKRIKMVDNAFANPSVFFSFPFKASYTRDQPLVAELYPYWRGEGGDFRWLENIPEGASLCFPLQELLLKNITETDMIKLGPSFEKTGFSNGYISDHPAKLERFLGSLTIKLSSFSYDQSCLSLAALKILASNCPNLLTLRIKPERQSIEFFEHLNRFSLLTTLILSRINMPFLSVLDFPHLNSFQLHNSFEECADPESSNTAFVQFLKNQSRLTSLMLVNCNSLTTATFLAIGAWCPNLEGFFCDCPQFDDECVATILSNCPRLGSFYAHSSSFHSSDYIIGNVLERHTSRKSVLFDLKLSSSISKLLSPLSIHLLRPLCLQSPCLRTLDLPLREQDYPQAAAILLSCLQQLVRFNGKAVQELRSLIPHPSPPSPPTPQE